MGARREHCHGWLVVASCLLFAWMPAQSRADSRRFTVQPGDALSLLAERFGVTVEDLRAWNSLEDDRIYVGQELRVEEEAEEEPGEVYRVQGGETLSGIAARFGLSTDDLLQWNEGLDPDRIREGQSLRLVGNRHRIEHRVTAGETLSRIASRHGVHVRQLLGWNPRLRANLIREGQRIVLYSRIPESTSESVGLPYEGSLTDGVRARRHRGYVIRNRNRAFGTHETVRWLAEGFDQVRRQHPAAPRVRVHDISLRRGGTMAGHRSHQSGRDVDISFFLRRGCTSEAGCPMVRSAPHDLRIAPQWTLLEHWLKEGTLEAVFIDYSLIKPLYERAKANGATRSQLARWFQYPRGRTVPVGIIRHYRQHRDHMHVRFRCHDSDEACR